MRDLSTIKVAIVHDWLVGGGAEKVVLELHKIFPEAPIYTSYCTDEWREKLDNKVVTGWLQHFGKLRKFMVLPRIWWFGHLKFNDYDLVISSSGNGEAFSVKTPATTLHVNYCHTPTHYYWRHYNQYSARPGFGKFDPLARLGLKILVGPLRKWDYKAAQRPDVMIANSSHIQADIKKYYQRESTVVFPPVDTERFNSVKPQNERTGFVTAGRLAPMKRVDLIIKAAMKLNVRLTVIGRGPELASLKKIAGPNVTFKTDVTDEQMPGELASAEAFVFASFEDFGITPIEAMAAGTPTIALEAGGALDYVIPGTTGTFFLQQTEQSILVVMQDFDALKYSSDDIKQVANRFSTENFHKNIRTVLENVI